MLYKQVKLSQKIKKNTFLFQSKLLQPEISQNMQSELVNYLPDSYHKLFTKT